MAPFGHYLCLRKLVILYLTLFLFTFVLVLADDEQPQHHMGLQLQSQDQQPPIKNKTITSTTSTNLSPKNQTKLIKPISNSIKNQTNFLPNSSKNKTKLIQPSSDSSKSLNSTKPTSNSSKSANSTKPTSNSTKPSSFVAKNSSDLSKKTKPITTKLTQKPKQPKWIEQEEDEDDLVSEFRDLPTKFQETLLPDLDRISTTSKDYFKKANKEITKGFNPIVGKKYAPTIASIVSFAFILIPLILVSLFFNHIKAYFSLQKLLIFIQIYLSIYFAILCFSSLLTGLEPLKFFYATSQSTYVCLQVLQTLAYVLYLLLLLMYLVLVFSTETGPASKFTGLGQVFVGFAVGLHYYVTVFHRVVMHQPPKTNWKIHGIYATCFLMICLLAGADRRKKAYLVEGGEEGKKS